jgi:hypothetical protein
MSKKLLLCTALSLVSATAHAGFTDPTIASLKIFGMAVSTNADCSNATVVGYNAAGTDYDFKKAPTLFTGAVAAGTYQCVILYMNSLLTFTPLATTGNCTAGTSYTRNVAGPTTKYTPGSPNSSNVLVYGADVSASGSGSTDITHFDKVLLFLSTGSTGDGSTGHAFQQPLAATPTYGIKLGAPFVVSDSGSSGTFVVNFNGKVDGSQSPCDLGPPTFTFR